MKNVFEIFSIPPTNDYRIVKRAYMKLALANHPDKCQGEGRGNPEVFKEVSIAWSKVDNEKKLNTYYQAYLEKRLDQLNQTTLEAQSYDPNAVSNTDAIVTYNRDTEIEIYLNVILKSKNSYSNPEYMIDLEPLTTKSTCKALATFLTDNRPHYADIITKLSSKSIMQIGLTAEEAEKIADLHNYRYSGPGIIVKFKVPLSRLSDSRESEKNKYGPTVLNAKEGDYFWLERHTTIVGTDVLSMYGRTKNYGNSGGHGLSRVVNQYWPENFVFEFDKPLLEDQQPLSLQAAAQEEIDRLNKKVFFGIFSKPNAEEKISAIKLALEHNNVEELNKALAIRRYPSLFSSKNSTTSSKENIENKTKINIPTGVDVKELGARTTRLLKNS